MSDHSKQKIEHSFGKVKRKKKSSSSLPCIHKMHILKQTPTWKKNVVNFKKFESQMLMYSVHTEKTDYAT